MKEKILEKDKVNKEGQFIALTNDILFKYSFGHKDNIKVLEDFLECYYGYEKGYLHNKIKVKMESGLPVNKLDDSCLRGDLIVEIEEEYTLIVDIEAYTHFGIDEESKSILYLTRIYSGEFNKAVKKKRVVVKQINIVKDLVESLYNGEEELKYTFSLGDDSRNKLQMDVLDLDIASKMNYTNDRLIKYLKFINAKSKEERVSITKGDKLLMEFEEWIDEFNNDPEIIKLQKEKALLKAKGEGHYEGKQEGIKEGETKGKAKKQKEIINKLISKGKTKEEISDLLDIPIEDMEKY